MKNIESAVAQHYGDADLLARIVNGLEKAGADLNNLRPDDLSPVDEFHVGGRKATEHVVAKLSLNEGSHVLDVGCGIGGAARFVASQTGCRVTGVDLTSEYIAIAKRLTDLTALSDKVTFDAASALDMPYEPESFDAAITIHVAMNIADRAALYSEIARVLKPDATLCIFDLMRTSDEDLTFPVPWAQTPETSHLVTPEDMRSLLEATGFEVHEVEDRTDFTLEFFAQSQAAAADGPPPLGIHLVMGASAPEKLKNVLSNIKKGSIAPVQIVASRRTAPA